MPPNRIESANLKQRLNQGNIERRVASDCTDYRHSCSVTVLCLAYIILVSRAMSNHHPMIAAATPSLLKFTLFQNEFYIRIDIKITLNTTQKFYYFCVNSVLFFSHSRSQNTLKIYVHWSKNYL